MRIAFVNLYVSDLQLVGEFYGSTLGLSLLFKDAEHGYASFQVGPITLGLAVDDLVSAHARLEARGVVFPMPPERQPWGGFMALLADPFDDTLYLDEVSAAHGSDSSG